MDFSLKPQVRYMSATQLSALAAVPAAAACGSVATMAGGGQWRGRVNQNGWKNEDWLNDWLIYG